MKSDDAMKNSRDETKNSRDETKNKRDITKNNDVVMKNKIDITRNNRIVLNTNSDNYTNNKNRFQNWKHNAPSPGGVAGNRRGQDQVCRDQAVAEAERLLAQFCHEQIGDARAEASLDEPARNEEGEDYQPDDSIAKAAQQGEDHAKNREMTQVELLEQKLAKAVEEERYENAADIRDRINLLNQAKKDN